MYTNYQGTDREDQHTQQTQLQHQRSNMRLSSNSTSNGGNNSEDSAGALIDSYFLPGGILDPDEIASSQQHHQQATPPQQQPLRTGSPLEQHHQQRFQTQTQRHQQLHLYPGSASINSTLRRHRSNSLNSKSGAVGSVSLEIHRPTTSSTNPSNNFSTAVGVGALDPLQDNYIEGDTIYYPNHPNNNHAPSPSNINNNSHYTHNLQQNQRFSTLAELNNQSFTQSQQEALFRNSNRTSISSVTGVSAANHDMTIGGNWLTSQHDQQHLHQQQEQYHNSLNSGLTISTNTALPQAGQSINNKNPWGNNRSNIKTSNESNTDVLVNRSSNLQHASNTIHHSRHVGVGFGVSPSHHTSSGNTNNNNSEVSFLLNNHCSRGSLENSSTSNKSSNHNPQSIATQQHQHISHQNKQQQQIRHHQNSSSVQPNKAPAASSSMSASFQRPPPGFNSSLASNGDHNQLQQQQQQTHLHHANYQRGENVNDGNLMHSRPNLHASNNPSLDQRHALPQRNEQETSLYRHHHSQQQKPVRENGRESNMRILEQQQSAHRLPQHAHAQQIPQQHHPHTRQHVPYSKSKNSNSNFVQNHQHRNNNETKFEEDYDLASLNSKASRGVPSTIYVPEEDAISNSEDTLTICADSVSVTSLSNNLMSKKGENGKVGGGSGGDGGNNERKMSVLEETSQIVNEKRTKSKRQKKKRNKKRQQNQNCTAQVENEEENNFNIDRTKQKDCTENKDNDKGEALQHNAKADLSSSAGEGERHVYPNKASWTAATSSSSKATTVHRRPGKKAQHSKNQFHHHQQREDKGPRNDNYNGNKKNSSKQRNDLPREPLWDQLMEKLRALRPIVVDCAHLCASYSSTLTTKIIKWIVSFCPQRERFWFFVPLFCISFDMSFLMASMITALIGKLIYICLLMHKLAILEMLEFNSATLCYTLICFYPYIVTLAKDSFTFEEYWTVFIRWFAVDRLLCRPIRMKDTFLNRIKDEDRQKLALNTFGSLKAKSERITMKDVARLIIKFRAKEDQEETERVTMANHILLILRKITPLVLMVEVNVRRQGFLMSMSRTERILLSYGFAVIRSGYLFSPLIWMSWTLQLTIIMFAPASRFWAYLLMLVGLSAIRLSHYTASVEDLEGIYISYRDDDDYPRKKEKNQGLFS